MAVEVPNEEDPRPAASRIVGEDPTLLLPQHTAPTRLSLERASDSLLMRVEGVPGSLTRHIRQLKRHAELSAVPYV